MTGNTVRAVRECRVRAEMASGLERQGQYGTAAKYWLQSASLTRLANEAHWFESRAALCLRLAQVAPDGR
ncbi:ANR family transcriptional regulator [Enterobacter hormaechei]|uniref:ANR family transcriptional regulator n=1 Tax=Enterobacter hormaechei TaxID=158836 RepID=UPI0013EFA5CC|nr:ANR family transcriptional regulator [Enterobacter hormaechei]KAF6706045.1 ANR family transcriptional regulator [Enterobacter hormaechei]KAF6712802.1 ANR family transcriptional regulator [Enterobacter hormaechei]